MDMRRNVSLSHFQLRNILASTSRSQVYYPSSGTAAVHQFNINSGEGRTAMKLMDAPNSQITTLSADCGVLVAGGFNGEYLIQNLGSEAGDAPCREGIITNNTSSGITNHVQVHQSRQSSSPRAAFASNDKAFRVLDLATETWLSEHTFDEPLNCTALSPDGRLRVMVGDSYNFMVALADGGSGGRESPILQEISGHRDWGFSCAWADDGWTVATGFQDKAVKIWDARRWTDNQGMPNPVTTLRSEMASVRSLRFSPIGSGRRVLVAAEEADYINIIDARTFTSKQTVDIFGEIGGISFSNEGQDLLVLCCDRTRGGIMQLERCGLGVESTVQGDALLPSNKDDNGWPVQDSHDWPSSVFTDKKRLKGTKTRRTRAAAALDAMEPF
jgi:WD40 repeat protein